MILDEPFQRGNVEGHIEIVCFVEEEVPEGWRAMQPFFGENRRL